MAEALSRILACALVCLVALGASAQRPAMADSFDEAVAVASGGALAHGGLEEGARLRALAHARRALELAEAHGVPPSLRLRAVDLVVDLLTASATAVGALPPTVGPVVPGEPGAGWATDGARLRTTRSSGAGPRAPPRQHVLHIPKTMGRSVALAASSCPASAHVVAHGHGVTLAGLTATAGGHGGCGDSDGNGHGVDCDSSGTWRPGDEVVAVVRDPVARFLSAFAFFVEGGYRGAVWRRSDGGSQAEALEALALQAGSVALVEARLRDIEAEARAKEAEEDNRARRGGWAAALQLNSLRLQLAARLLRQAAGPGAMAP